jgi:hypothetical protein
MGDNPIEHKEDQLNPEEALIAGIKIVQGRNLEEGRVQVPIPTPEIDKLVEKKKKEASK